MGEHDPALSLRCVEPGKLDLMGLIWQQEAAVREGGNDKAETPEVGS